jgi:flagellar basal body-associated protein FliL
MADEEDKKKKQAPDSPEKDPVKSSAEEKHPDPQGSDDKPQEAGESTYESDKETDKSDKAQRTGIFARLLPWIVMAVVVLGCAGAGFGLAQLFAGSKKTRTDASIQQQKAPEEYISQDVSADSGGTWFYQMEPVIANLDVPGITRYVRTSLVLEINQQVDEQKGTALLEEKKPVLLNWLSIYLAGLTLEDIRGERNQRRIQTQIRDAFNETLFPDAKPQIVHVLFKEFAIQ